MIIDALTHITADGSWFGTHHDARLERLLAGMDDVGVDKSLLMGNPVLRDNGLVLKTASDHGEKFIPIGAVTPEMVVLQEIEGHFNCFKSGGFKGIKIHPRMLNLPFLSDEMDVMLNTAGKLGLPVFICTIYRPPAPLLKRPLYDVIYELCQRHKDTKIVLVHGGYYELLAVSEIIRPFENVMLDLSATLTRFAEASIGSDIRFLVKYFDRRLAVGSDFPEYTFGDVLKAFEFLGFSRELLENKGILGDNLYRFLDRFLRD